MARITILALSQQLAAVTTALHNVELRNTQLEGELALLKGTAAPAAPTDPAPRVVLLVKSPDRIKFEAAAQRVKDRQRREREYKTQPLTADERRAFEEGRLIVQKPAPVWGSNAAKAQAYCAAHGVSSVTAAELAAWDELTA